MKLNKYFLRKFIINRLKRFKPHLFTVFLDPRFKTQPFKQNGYLYFYFLTEYEVCKLIKEEYLK